MMESHVYNSEQWDSIIEDLRETISEDDYYENVELADSLEVLLGVREEAIAYTGETRWNLGNVELIGDCAGESPEGYVRIEVSGEVYWVG